MTPVTTRLLAGLRARSAGLSLDRELAAGCDPTANAPLAARASVLSSRRGRRRIAAGLRRVLAETHREPGLTAAVACDRQAVAMARPALEQLERAIREGGAVRPEGLALAYVLLCDPESALYLPAYPDRLHEVARTALLALSPGEIESRPVERLAPAQMTRVG